MDWPVMPCRYTSEQHQLCQIMRSLRYTFIKLVVTVNRSDSYHIKQSGYSWILLDTLKLYYIAYVKILDNGKCLYHFRCSIYTSRRLRNCLGFHTHVRYMRKLLKCYQMMEQG